MTQNHPLEQQVTQAAIEVMKNSYSPYSHFAVGAALLGKSGKIYTGVNVENASYGLTICAERSAIVRAISDGEKEFELLAVASYASPPASPCGACRQVIMEFGDISIVLVNPPGEKVYTTAQELLPNSFLFKR